jgi:putative transcriptional regulator
MVDHLSDLQNMAHEVRKVGGVSSDSARYIDSRVQMREFRSRLGAIESMPGQKIKELRERHQLTQAMLAEFMNLSTVTISKWERDEKNPNGTALMVLNALNEKGMQVFSWRNKRGSDV